jgi:PKD repeat protein
MLYSWRFAFGNDRCFQRVHKLNGHYQATNDGHMKTQLLRITIGLMLLAIVCAAGCKRNNVIVDYVHDPIASFSYTGNPITPATIVFANHSTDASSYVWDFGDNTNSSEMNPTKYYNTYGTYQVRLTATNEAGISNDTVKTLFIAPGTVYIIRMFLDNMPFTDSTGAPWNNDSEPTIYCTLDDSITTASPCVSTASGAVTVLGQSQLPVNWIISPPLLVTDWDRLYYLHVWNRDTSGNSIHIGATRRFSVNNIVNSYGFSQIAILENAASTIQGKLILSWQ